MCLNVTNMKALKPEIEYMGDNIVILKREQWGGKRAIISNYPGLLDKVLEYTWTLKNGEHHYLQCSKLQMTLHKFVLAFLHGEEQLNYMLESGNIIEHLDNDGLNCAYENLHIVSSNYNKAKAFTVDRAYIDAAEVPRFAIDVYYSHVNNYYQMQIFFNRNILFDRNNGESIESISLQYDNFALLFKDWLYLLESRKDWAFDVNKLSMVKLEKYYRPKISLNDGEGTLPFIQREGQYFLRLNNTVSEKAAFVVKSAYKKKQGY